MKQTLLTNSLVFATSRYVLLGMSLVRNFFVAKYLGPTDYGVWVVIGLVLTYGDQIHLGLRHAGDKEIPFYRGQGKSRESIEITRSILGGILWLSAIAFCFLMLYSFVFVDVQHPVVRSGLLIAAFIIVMDQVNRFYLMILRTRHEFVLSSTVEASFEFLRTVLVTVLVVYLHFFGAMLALLLASVATGLYFLLLYKERFTPRFSVQPLRPLVALGLPLSATGLLYVLILNLDRVVGAFTLSKEDLGLYGMAALLAQVPITSTHGVSSVIYPRISEQFGESRDPIRLRSFFSPAITGAAFIAPLLVAVLFVGGRFLLVWLLPAFEESIGPLFLLSYGVYLLCLSPIAAALLMAAGRNHLYLRAEVVALIGAMVAYGVLTLTGELSKMLIAGTASASAFLFSTVLLNHAFRTIALDAKGRVQEIAKLYLPWLLSGIAVAFVHIYLPLDSSQGVWNCFLRTLVSAACYLIVYSPMIYLLEKNTGILNRVVRTVLVRGGKAT